MFKICTSTVECFTTLWKPVLNASIIKFSLMLTALLLVFIGLGKVLRARLVSPLFQKVLSSVAAGF